MATKKEELKKESVQTGAVTTNGENVAQNPRAAIVEEARASIEGTTRTPTATTVASPAKLTPSSTVESALGLLQEQINAQPNAYQSQWSGQINQILDNILNRKDFSYDINKDALWNQYKDQYVAQGQKAMMDAIGQSSALTGGYGNSWAQTAGQQAYQGSLQQLNDKVPQLYQLALDRYNAEGDEMYRQYSALGQQDELDYGRYRDAYGDWRDLLNYRYNDYINKRDFAYQQERDKIEDERWQTEFDEAVRQFNKQMSKSSSSGSGYRYSSPSKKTSKNDDDDDEEEVEEIKTYTNDFRGVTQRADDYVKAGASKSEINKMLTQARQAGYITQAQYTSLRSLYAR